MKMDLSITMKNLNQNNMEEPKPTFIKSDMVDGQWLSPVPSERKWQEEQLTEIFGHYPTASPRWQYMNGLIKMVLELKKHK